MSDLEPPPWDDVAPLPEPEPGVEPARRVAGAGKRRKHARGAAPHVVPLHEDTRPVVRLTVDTRTAVLAAVDALARTEPGLFVRTGRLVHVVEDQERGGLAIRPLKPGRLATMIAERCRVVVPGGDSGEVAAQPPRWLLDGVIGEDAWPGVRVLRGVTTVPVLRADGTVVTDPGYDLASGMLYVPTVDVPRIPEHPSLADARSAVALLHDVLRDFPFRSPADRSVALSALLAIIARPAIDGPVPLHMIEANIRGAGKSLLGDVIVSIPLGHEAPRIPPCTTEDEWRKRILALLLGGSPALMIDNVTGELRSAALDAVLTGARFSDRILGLSEDVIVDARAVWIATANNAVLGGDLPRRTLIVRLQSPHEHPEERTDLSRSEGELRSLVRARRGELVAAALTMLRAWFAAGRPAPSTPIRDMGSYPGFTAIVRHALVWCGEADPADVIPDLRERSDEGACHLRALLAAWRAVYGDDWTAAGQVIRDVSPTDGKGLDASLLALAEQIAGWAARGERLPSAQILGRRLRTFVGRVAAGLVLEHRKGDGHVAEWRVMAPSRPADELGESGESGESHSLPRARGHAHAHAHARTRESGHETPPTPLTPPEQHPVTCSCAGCRARAREDARAELAAREEGGPA